MRSNILFITGTDTGVGKTSIAALLIRNLCNRGVLCHAFKPIETGCLRDSKGELIPADASLLREANRCALSPDQTVIYRFATPVAPLAAARIEQQSLSWEQLRRQTLVLAEGYELLIVEGAGGLLVPITAEKTFADLAHECGAQVLLVVGSRLGAINHTLLTLEAVQARELPLLGYVLNEGLPNSISPAFDDERPAILSNRALLKELAGRYSARELSAVPAFAAKDSAESWFHAWSDSVEIEAISSAVIRHFNLRIRNSEACPA